MTSTIPPAAVPGPEDTPDWERQDAQQQPDPFGDPTDAEGGGDEVGDAGEDGERPKDDPRGQ